jgi:hypothetical protein
VSTVSEFSESLRAARHSAVHLELRDVYGVASEAEEFAAWQADPGPRDTDAHALRRKEWLDLVAETVGRGVVMRRARIVSEPASSYIKFEHAGTPLNVSAGELVRWLPRRVASDIALPGNDFWLFDEETALFNHFTGDGAWAGVEELRTEPAVARLCAEAFEEVWHRATPHEDYKLV